MAAEGKEIVILMFKFSVVVKGIEKKLKDMGYDVSTVTEDLDNEIKRLAGRVALFLFYLPGDIDQDFTKKNKLHQLSEIVADKEQKMILVGEAIYKDELLSENPLLQSFSWLDRPVDMGRLEAEVEQSIREKDTAMKKKRILIVDDDPSYAKMVREWIKDQYRVDIVTDGMRAITFLVKLPENDRVNMILLDYEMPVVDGPQVLQMLKQEESTAHIPVIFLTGIGTKEAVSRVMSLKPEGYLLKSTTKTDILDFLNKKLS